MTLATRNTILILGTIVAAILIAAYAATGYLIVAGPLAGQTFAVSQTQRWFGVTWNVGSLAAYQSLAAAGVLGLLATGGGITFVRLFRRVSSAELYFVTLFLLSLSVELVRIGQPLVELMNLPDVVSVGLTRLIIFGRLFGAFSLFAAGVYAVGADYPRIGTITLLLAALAFMVVYLVAVDSSVMSASFVHVTGGRDAVDLMLGFLSLATIVNFTISWLRGHRERGAAIALAIAALVVGEQLVLYVPSLFALIAGLALVGSGILAFMLVNRAYYLWY